MATTVTRPWQQGYIARVSNTYLRSAAAPENELRIYTQDSLAKRSDDEGSVDEIVLEIGNVFARTDWSGGEGYDWDPPTFKDSQRDTERSFWDSVNVDVSRPDPGEPYLLRLSRSAEQWGGSVTSPADMSVSNTYVYVTDGTDIKRFTDWDTTTPETTYTDPTWTIVSLAAAPNDAVMAVDTVGDVWYKAPTGSTFTKIYDQTSDGDTAVAVWYVKARWVVFTYESGVGQLAEMPTSGGAIATHVFDTMDAQVYSVVSSGPAIVAAVFDGTLRTYTPDNADSAAGQTLIPKGRTQLPYGESPYLLGDNSDILGILTVAEESGVATKTVRFYQATVLDARFDYTVGQLQLRREWPGVTLTQTPARDMAASRDELMWTLLEGDGTCYLWRLDIVTGGLSRHTTVATSEATMQVEFDGKWAALVGSDVYIEADTYQNDGYLITPNITLGVNTEIAWLAHVFASEFQVGSGAVAELYYSIVPEAITDPTSENWVRVRRINANQAGQTSAEQPLFSTKSRTIALQIRLYADASGASTPKVSRTAIRGIPTHRDFYVEIPVNISDYIDVPNRQPLHIPGRGQAEHAKLMGLIGAHIELEVYRPELQFNGIVNNILEPVEYVSSRGTPTRMAMIQFLGSLSFGTTLSITAPVGDEVLGIGLLGVARLGVGESSV